MTKWKDGFFFVGEGNPGNSAILCQGCSKVSMTQPDQGKKMRLPRRLHFYSDDTGSGRFSESFIDSNGPGMGNALGQGGES